MLSICNFSAWPWAEVGTANGRHRCWHETIITLIDLVHLLTHWPSIFFASRTMPKGSRRRKLPVTVAERYGSSSSSTPRTSRTVIRKFHTLLKRQKSAQGDTLTSINHDLEKLGGLEKYQHMSCIGQGTDRGGGSERVLIGWMKQMGWADQKHRHVRFVYTGST
jgi:hypothetical protein